MVPSKQLITLPSFSDVERKLIEFFRKKLACFSQQDSACPEQRFPVKKKKLKFFSVHLFWNLSGDSIDTCESFSALLSKLRSTCPEVHFWEIFWNKKERLLKCSFFLSKIIAEGLSKLLFTTSQELFGTKTFFSFSDSELNFLGLLTRKVSPVLSKQHYGFREQHFEAKWCSWRE